MDRLTLVGARHDLESVLGQLTTLGAADVREDAAAAEAYDEGRSERLARHQHAITEIENIQQRLALMIARTSDILHIKKPMFTVRRSVKLADIESAGARRDEILATLGRLEQLLEEQRRLSEQAARLSSRRALLSPWRTLVLPGSLTGDEALPERARTALIFGTFASDEIRHEALEALEEAVPAFASETLYRTEQGMAEMVVVPAALKQTASRVLHLQHLAPFPAENEAEARGDFPRAWRELEGQIDAVEAERETAEEGTRALAVQRDDMELLYDWYAIRLREAQAMLRLVELERVFVLNCYVPTRRADAVERALHEAFTLHIERETCAPSEEVPVLLENPRLLQPYESILSTFSMPRPGHDADPTSIMGIFYAVFFGMMLSDAGYGLLLALLCGWLIWGVRVEGNFRRMSFVLFYGGLSSIVFGLLFGGFFAMP